MEDSDHLTCRGRDLAPYHMSRSFYMIDTLAFILEYVGKIAGYLHMVSETEQITCPLPTEFFEFYAILMPFGCLVSTVELECCSLCVIVSLIRDLSTALREVGEFSGPLPPMQSCATCMFACSAGFYQQSD
jgi:hypothetical protein